MAASHAKEAAIEKARAYAGTESGRYDAYVASVRSPAAPTVSVGDSGTARPTWVVEASDVALPQRSTDPLLRGGATNPGPYRMVVFVDDATLTTAGAWAACPPMPAPQPAGSATGQDSPPASAIPPPAGPAARAGRLCQPADLAASWDGPSALAGAFLYSVILTNTSATDCDLGVAPSVIAVGDGGAAPVAGLPGPTPLDRPADMIHTLAPGQRAYLQLVTSHACDLRREGFHDVVVQLQGGELRVHTDQGIHVDCGMTVGGFYSLP